MDGLLAVLMLAGVAAVVGSILILRKVPRDIRPVAIVPLLVVLVGFAIGFLALSGVFG
ncbi:MAG: hypothetical protein QM708_09700 [Propioniciclava sp.]|uniref:hypothetical protein n=1 Tax=Propioniciclava sp. TaxID=2038686 RepID=UPI0039E7166A